MARFLILAVLVGSVSTVVAKVPNLDWSVLNDAEKICDVINSSGITRKCAKQLNETCYNRDILYTMMDASSKFPYPGIMSGNMRIEFGNFDECINIDHKYSGSRILGKYCLAGLIIPDLLHLNDPNQWFKLSTCIPDACTASDYTQLFKKLLFGLPVPFGFTDLACSTKEPLPYKTGDIVVLSVAAIILVVIVLSTLYDAYLFHYEMKAAHPIYVSFSLLTNGRKLLETPRGSKEQISVFAGMRTVSTLWIIGKHGFTIQQTTPMTNLTPRMQDRFFITTSETSVDTFFFMSGFLLAFNYLKGKARPALEQSKGIPKMILLRYLRLTPAALAIYLTVVYLARHIGDGPFYHALLNKYEKHCRDNVWSFFLYLQNYYNYDNVCIDSTWYLSADMQLIVLSPIVMIPLSVYVSREKFRQTMWALAALSLFWTVVPIALKFKYRDYNNTYALHDRAVSFINGIMLGTFMRLYKDQPFLNGKFDDRYAKIINLGMWIISLCIMLAVWLGIYVTELDGSYETKAWFTILRRSIWCISIAWITYSCYHGRGGVINELLSAPIFQVMGKLSYSMYLIHMVIESHFIAQSRIRRSYSDYEEFIYFGGYVMVTTIVAVGWVLAFESPMLTVSKVIFGGR